MFLYHVIYTLITSFNLKANIAGQLFMKEFLLVMYAHGEILKFVLDGILFDKPITITARLKSEERNERRIPKHQLVPQVRYWSYDSF